MFLYTISFLWLAVLLQSVNFVINQFETINFLSCRNSLFFRCVQLARLSSTEMNAVTNLEFLGVQVSKKPHSGVEKLALKFGARKVKLFMQASTPKIEVWSKKRVSLATHDIYWVVFAVQLWWDFLLQSKRPLRRTREQDEESWQLSRFYPLVQVSPFLSLYMIVKVVICKEHSSSCLWVVGVDLNRITVSHRNVCLEQCRILWRIWTREFFPRKSIHIWKTHLEVPCTLPLHFHDLQQPRILDQFNPDALLPKAPVPPGHPGVELHLMMVTPGLHFAPMFVTPVLAVLETKLCV